MKKRVKILSASEIWSAKQMFKYGYDPIKNKKLTPAQRYIAGLEAKHGKRVL